MQKFGIRNFAFVEILFRFNRVFREGRKKQSKKKKIVTGLCENSLVTPEGKTGRVEASCLNVREKSKTVKGDSRRKASRCSWRSCTLTESCKFDFWTIIPPPREIFGLQTRFRLGFFRPLRHTSSPDDVRSVRSLRLYQSPESSKWVKRLRAPWVGMHGYEKNCPKVTHYLPQKKKKKKKKKAQTKPEPDGDFFFIFGRTTFQLLSLIFSKWKKYFAILSVSMSNLVFAETRSFFFFFGGYL